MKIRNIIFSLFVALVFSSCGSEFGLASRFVGQSQKIQAAVYFPESAKVTLIQHTDGTYSKVLDSLNQDAFLDMMYLAYAEEMKNYGVKVYIPDDPDLVPVDSTHWLVMLSNMEIQGLYTEYVDHLFDYIDNYDYTFALNTVNVASWFEMNDGEWLPVLFDEHNLRDDFESYVSNRGTQGAQYYYNINPITNADLYDYAVFLGKRYASFTYNYMMNRFVGKSMQRKGKEARFQLRWDPYEEYFYFQEEGEGFVELKVEN